MIFLADNIEETKSADTYMFSFEKNLNLHNHKLEYQAEDIFTPEIIREIDKIKSHSKTINDIKEIINKTFKTNFDYAQILYRVNKLLKSNFGVPNEDAANFVLEMENDVKENGGFCDFELGINRQLKKGIYVSSTMLKFSKFFLDIVIVDATYKRNRFNMPLVNVVGINNHGRTIMLAFALLDNEQLTSYVWIFERLKKLWQKDPDFFISDECNEIIKGIEHNFKSKRLICAWHLQRHFVSRFSCLEKKFPELYNQAVNLPFITREDKFAKIIEEILNVKDFQEKQKKYLKEKLNEKHTWAKCVIKNYFTAGVSTTSTVECMHKVLKDKLNSNSSMKELLQVFRNIETKQIEDFSEEFTRHTKNISNNISKCQILKDVSPKYSDYILKKFEKKLGQAFTYSVEIIRPSTSSNKRKETNNNQNTSWNPF